MLLILRPNCHAGQQVTERCQRRRIGGRGRFAGAGRTAPCRPARCVAPFVRSPPRSRRSCPSTACRAPSPARVQLVLAALAQPARTSARWRAGIALLAAACTSARAASGAAAPPPRPRGPALRAAHAALAGLSGELTCSRHSAAARDRAAAPTGARRSSAGRRRAPRRTARRRRASCWPAARPMKCQVSARPAQRRDLCQRLLQVALAEVASRPRAAAARISCGGCALATARSVTRVDTPPGAARRPRPCGRARRAMRVRQILRTH